MPQQTPAEIEQVIREALDTGQRLSIRYLNTHLIVTPLRLAGSMLTTWADSMNRARQFRVEFIREAIAVGPAPEPDGTDDEDEDEDTGQTMGRPRLYTEPRQRLTLELPQALIQQLDTLARAAGMTRTAWIDAAIREKLSRETGDAE